MVASWNDASRSCAHVTDLIVFDRTELTPRAGLAELERVVTSYNPVGNWHSAVFSILKAAGVFGQHEGRYHTLSHNIAF